MFHIPEKRDSSSKKEPINRNIQFPKRVKRNVLSKEEQKC